jgi:hypothetical protein
MRQELCYFKEVHDEFKTKVYYTNTLQGYVIFISPTHIVLFDRTFNTKLLDACDKIKR